MTSRFSADERELRDFFTTPRRTARGTQSDVQAGLVEVSFGEYLVNQMLITRQQLLLALQMQDRNPGVRLGECIAAMGIMPYRAVEDRVRAWKSLGAVEL